MEMQHQHHIDSQWRAAKQVPEEDCTHQVHSPLTVSADFYSAPANEYSISHERAVTLPLFADLIRASQMTSDTIPSPLPSLSKTSLGFILSAQRSDVNEEPSTPVATKLEPIAACEDDESYGRASVSSPRSSGSLSPSDSSKGKSRPASRTCKFEGCKQYVVDHGLCVRHGGGKRCTMEGCSSRAKHYGRCWRHGGSLECKITGCVNRAKSRGFCWSHGGGTKCKNDDCEKIAISNGLCWAHGGGKRCAMKGCMKQAYERTDNYCNSHYQQTKRAAQQQS